MASLVTIKIGSSNWVQKAQRAINQKKRLKLVLQGAQALTLAEGLRRSRPARPNRVARIAVADDIAIVAALAITAIALAGLGTLAAVCLYGINQGYNIKARHVTHGPLPFDDELNLTLVPPA